MPAIWPFLARLRGSLVPMVSTMCFRGNRVFWGPLGTARIISPLSPTPPPHPLPLPMTRCYTSLWPGSNSLMAPPLATIARWWYSERSWAAASQNGYLWPVTYKGGGTNGFRDCPVWWSRGGREAAGGRDGDSLSLGIKCLGCGGGVRSFPCWRDFLHGFPSRGDKFKFRPRRALWVLLPTPHRMDPFAVFVCLDYLGEIESPSGNGPEWLNGLLCDV